MTIPREHRPLLQSDVTLERRSSTEDVYKRRPSLGAKKEADCGESLLRFSLLIFQRCVIVLIVLIVLFTANIARMHLLQPHLSAREIHESYVACCGVEEKWKKPQSTQGFVL